MHARTSLDRRRFLGAAAGFCGIGCLPHGLALLDRPAPRTPPGLLFPISLAQWSLHQALFAKELDNLDFPARARQFGIDGVEYVNSFWKDKATDAAYVAELKKRCASEGVTSVLVEGGGAVHGAMLRAGLVDEVKLFVAPIFIGGDGIPVVEGQGVMVVNEAPRLAEVRTRRLGDDVLIEGIFAGGMAVG